MRHPKVDASSREFIIRESLRSEKSGQVLPESDGDSGCAGSSNNSISETTETENLKAEGNELKIKLENDDSDDGDTEKRIIALYEKISKKIDEQSREERAECAKKMMSENYLDVLPKTLCEVAAGVFIDGDHGFDVNDKPEWLDMDKFKRGQKFAMEYLFGIYYSELLSLFTLFSFQEGLKPLIITGKSSTPYTAFKRYLSTGSRVRRWYTEDPWQEGSGAYNDIRAVRKMHENVRKKLTETPSEELQNLAKIDSPWCPSLKTTKRDFESTCPVPAIGQCPHDFLLKYPNLKAKRLNQAEMSMTQFGFFGFALLSPETFGIHDATDEDFEAFCHVWRALGYLLGIEDDCNFCRGTLDEIRQRSRDYLEYWIKPNFRQATPEWEHMMRCVVEGLTYYFPGSTYETCLLSLSEIMNLHMPRLRKEISYFTWIRYNLVKFYFYCGSRFKGMRNFMNNRLNKSLDKAVQFDEQKHAELQRKSEKTLDSYNKKVQNHQLRQVQVD